MYKFYFEPLEGERELADGYAPMTGVYFHGSIEKDENGVVYYDYANVFNHENDKLEEAPKCILDVLGVYPDGSFKKLKLFYWKTVYYDDIDDWRTGENIVFDFYTMQHGLIVDPASEEDMKFAMEKYKKEAKGL